MNDIYIGIECVYIHQKYYQPVCVHLDVSVFILKYTMVNVSLSASSTFGDWVVLIPLCTEPPWGLRENMSSLGSNLQYAGCHADACSSHRGFLVVGVTDSVKTFKSMVSSKVSWNCRISLTCGFWLSIYSSSVLGVFGVRWYLQRSCTVITLTQGQAIPHYLSSPVLTLLHQCSCPCWALHWALVQSAGLNRGICLAMRAPHFK